MAKQLTEQQLRRQAVQALSDSLGPVDALRFLALVSRDPFDYQEWRREYFSRYDDLDELLQEARKHNSSKNSEPVSVRCSSTFADSLRRALV
jgi:hypothetical protein